MHRFGGGLAIFIVALGLRVLHLFQIRGTPITELLLIDSETYHRFAGLILRGEFRGESVYSMNVLYPWFLAGVYRLFGENPDAARLVQAGLGAVNAALVLALARRWFDRPTACVAGLLAAIYPPSIFYSGTLLTPVLIETFCLLTLLALAAWTRQQRSALLVLAGLSLGLAALGRGNSILLVPLSLFFFRHKTGEWRRALRPWSAFALATLSLLGLVSARNFAVERQFVPISANYAAFYIGHHPGATGLYVMPGFVTTAAFEGEVLGTREAISKRVGRELTLAESSHWLFQEGLRYMGSHPMDELRLAVRKLYYLVNRTESPTNLNFHLATDFSPLLRKFPIHFGWLVALGLLGIIFSFHRRGDLLLAHLYLLVYVITSVLFFVSAEYRLPMVPVLIAFSAHAVLVIFDATAAYLRPLDTSTPPTRGSRQSAGRLPGNARPIVIAVVLLPPLLLATSVRDELLTKQSLKRVDYYNLGTLYKQRGALDRAADMLRRSIAIDSAYSPALLSLSEVEQRQGNTVEAMEYSRRARALSPQSLNPPRRALDAERIAVEKLYLGGSFQAAAEQFGGLAEAFAAAGDTAAFISMKNNAGLSRYKLRDYDGAERIFRDLIAQNPRYVRAHTNLGLVLEAMLRPCDAAAVYRQALVVEPGNIKARQALEKLTARGC